MIDFKKWLDYQEFFLNTDNLFVEVFNKVNLDGVKIQDNFGEIGYDFEDDINGQKYFYTVTIHSDKNKDFINDYNDLYIQFKNKYPKSFDVAQVYLSIEDESGRSSYGVSNMGNQWFVYGKLIACIQDAVSKYKPLFLKFSGAQPSMDLVYDKFIKMSQKIYPQDAYVSYLKDYYIRKEVYDLISNDSSLKLAKKERENNLINTRDQKKRIKDMYSRMQSRNRIPSPPPLTADSIF